MRNATPVRGGCLMPLKSGPNCHVFLNKKEGEVYKYYSARERPDEKLDLDQWKSFSRLSMMTRKSDLTLK